VYWITHHLIITPFTMSEMLSCYKEEKKKAFHGYCSTEVVSWEEEFGDYLSILLEALVPKTQALFLHGYNPKNLSIVPS